MVAATLVLLVPVYLMVPEAVNVPVMTNGVPEPARVMVLEFGVKVPAFMLSTPFMVESAAKVKVVPV